MRSAQSILPVSGTAVEGVFIFAILSGRELLVRLFDLTTDHDDTATTCLNPHGGGTSKDSHQLTRFIGHSLSHDRERIPAGSVLLCVVYAAWPGFLGFSTTTSSPGASPQSMVAFGSSLVPGSGAPGGVVFALGSPSGWRSSVGNP